MRFLPGHVSPSDITATELYTESLLIRTPSRTFLALKGSVAFILFSRVNPVARQTLVSWSSSLKTDGVSSSAGNKNRRFITTENKPTEHPNVSRVKASPHDVTPKGLDSVQPLKRIHLSPVLNRSKSSSNLVEVHSGYDQVKATQNQYSAHQANQSPPKPVKVCSSFKTTPRLLTKAPRVMASFRIDLKLFSLTLFWWLSLSVHIATAQRPHIGKYTVRHKDIRMYFYIKSNLRHFNDKRAKCDESRATVIKPQAQTLVFMSRLF